jgi:hypothetical protein
VAVDSGASCSEVGVESSMAQSCTSPIG